MSDSFTCITCRVLFADGETQREHYRTDWHRYNLKRKVAELPPINADEFKNRVLSKREQDAVTNVAQYCDVCHKRFNNEKSYGNHLLSKRHKENQTLWEDYHVVRPGAFKSGDNTKSEIKSEKVDDVKDVKEEEEEDDDDDDDNGSWEEIDSDEWDEDFVNPVENHVCLFCTHRNRNLTRSLRHMSEAHSFFIPDLEYCTDLKGLIHYLGEKIYVGHMCLWCNTSFHSGEAVQGHMRDKGHTKMLHEGATLIEFVDYYDYTSSYPEQSLEPDEEVDLNVIDGSDYQLVLPSGAVIGHRSLVRYYKQNFNPNLALVVKPGRGLRKVMTHYRALGWADSKQEQLVKKARDINYMKRLQSKWATKLSFKANKLQQHFRPQVNF